MLPRPRTAGLLFLVLLTVLALLLPPPYKGRLATFGVVHETMHILVFFSTYLLISAGSRTLGKSTFVLFGLLAFGTALEILQTRAYGTPLEFADVLLNVFGTTLGFLTRSIWISLIQAC
jgi:hypothetical protein